MKTPSRDTLEKRISMFSRGMRYLSKRATSQPKPSPPVSSMLSVIEGKGKKKKKKKVRVGCLSSPLTSIVHLVEAIISLGSDISNHNARERLMIIERSQWDDKHMCTIVLAINKQPRLDDSMGAKSSQSTDPPLGSCESGAVDFPLVRLPDECGCGLQS